MTDLTSDLARRGLVPELLRRASDPEAFGRWAEQVAGTGYCQHPIRLSGQQNRVDTRTGEVTTLIDTTGEPDGVLLVACQNRRATVCPSCAKTYQTDAWHLLSAGLRGGKGVPATVAGHPCVFATLTAPSFGPVHSRRLDRQGRPRRCHPRPSPESDLLGFCVHGQPTACTAKHRPDDPLLGQALCPGCFDYRSAVLFNAHITALWQNTVLRTRRGLAAALGIPVRQLGDHLRVSFGKVAEYQLRGVVHLHVLVRLDGPTAEVPPPDSVTAASLQQVVTAAARQAKAKLPGDLGLLAWGEQLDVHPLPRSRDGSLQPAIAKVVGYLAKYATKSTDSSGALDRPMRRASEIQNLRVNPHLRQMVATCWQLGNDPLYRPLRLRAWAHTLGFRGHLTTKSRTYSTTFTALREARRVHRSPDPNDPAQETEQVATLRYAGRGYTTSGDALLAATARQQRDETRRAMRLQRRSSPSGPCDQDLG